MIRLSLLPSALLLALSACGPASTVVSEAPVDRAEPAPPANLQERRLCVIDAGAVREVAVGYDPATGDHWVGSRRLDDVYPEGREYAAATAWYIQNAPITVFGQPYTKYGLPRVLGTTEVSRVAEVDGVAVFAEAGLTGRPEVVYVPVRRGCEFQPYAIAVD